MKFKKMYPDSLLETLPANGGKVAIIYLESPANPTNALVDIEGVADARTALDAQQRCGEGAEHPDPDEAQERDPDVERRLLATGTGQEPQHRERQHQEHGDGYRGLAAVVGADDQTGGADDAEQGRGPVPDLGHLGEELRGGQRDDGDHEDRRQAHP